MDWNVLYHGARELCDGRCFDCDTIKLDLCERIVHCMRRGLDGSACGLRMYLVFDDHQSTCFENGLPRYARRRMAFRGECGNYWWMALRIRNEVAAERFKIA